MNSPARNPTSTRQAKLPATTMSTNRARWTQYYTEEQKNALLEAVLVDGMRVAPAVRLAAQGRLKGTPAVEWHKNYAYKVVARNRASYEAKNDQALALAIDRALHDAALGTLKQLRALNEKDDPDPAKVKATVLTLRTLKADLKKPPKPKAEKPGPEKPVTGDVLGELLGLAGENGGAS